MSDKFNVELWQQNRTVIVGITSNTEFFQNTCFKERSNMVVGKSPQNNGKLL